MEKEYNKRYPKYMGDEQERIKFATVVSTVFHNAGVEYEYVNDFSNSLICYSKAMRISQIHLGKNDPISQTFHQNFENVKERVNKNRGLI